MPITSKSSKYFNTANSENQMKKALSKYRENNSLRDYYYPLTSRLYSEEYGYNDFIIMIS